jgi:hypothetical protein
MCPAGTGRAEHRHTFHDGPDRNDRNDRNEPISMSSFDVVTRINACNRVIIGIGNY